MRSDLTDSQRRRSGRFLPLRLIGVILAAALAVLMPPTEAQARRAVVLNVDGAIGPAMADYVVRALEATSMADTALVVLRMNTPGGLDTSMREIVRAILASPVPVAVYVAPGGSRAASAGTFIMYAGAVAAMAPGTNLGAATPVPLARLPLSRADPGEQANPEDVESRKAINDAVAYIRGLADLHGRNADWAAEAVRGAASLPAPEAQKLRVVDVVADDVPDLLRKIDGRTATVAGQPVRLETAGLEVVRVEPDWRTGLLAAITHPNVAYLLMLLGVLGLVLELTTPGAILPGVVGGISLLTALFALNMLPIDHAGAGLVLLGLAFMVAEVFIGSFGVIGAGGLVALALGSIIMFRPNAPEYSLSVPLVVGTTIVAAGFLILVLALARRAMRRRVVTGREAMMGAEGAARGWQGTRGSVQVMGEIWSARADRPLQPGTRIRVVDREGLVLTVEPIQAPDRVSTSKGSR
jgi:membrane-bound serine protease (ClpP class)